MMMFAAPGCTFNFNSSPIHSALKSEDLKSRVSANFRIGEPWQEVRDRCKALSLVPQREYSKTPVCTGAIGDSYVVALSPPALSIKSYFWYTPQPSLTFGFDDGPNLLCVQLVSRDTDRRKDKVEGLLP